MITNKQLQTLATKISKKYFNEKPKGKISFNYRMKTNSANFTYQTKNGEMTSWKIGINPLAVSYFGKKGIIRILKRQLILDYQAQNHLPCGFNSNLYRIAKKINAPVYLKKILPDNSHYYVYQCTNCLHSFLQKNKINTATYSCANKLTNAFGRRHTCDGRLICVGKVSGRQLHSDKNNALAQAKHRAKLFKNYKHRMFAKFEK